MSIMSRFGYVYIFTSVLLRNIRLIKQKKLYTLYIMYIKEYYSTLKISLYLSIIIINFRYNEIAEKD